MNNEVLDYELIAIHKHKYKHQLAPILEMINHRKFELSSSDWSEFVERVKHSMLKKPDQYLFGELLSEEILTIVINEIFQESFTVVTRDNN